MDAIERLAAVEAVRGLKARYFRFIDTKRWDEIVGLFTRDMRVIGENGAVWLEGGEAFADSLGRSLERSVSVHQGFMPEIEIVDADNATGIWAMQDVIHWEDRHPTRGWRSIVGQGHYHETYRREGGAWRIASLALTRLRLDVVR